MSRADAAGDSSLGQLLKDARERRGLTLEQVSSDTKIPLRHLQAFERDDLGTMPPGLYLRGQLRACAKAVHLDPELALTRLEGLQGAKTAANVEPPAPAPAPPPPRRRLFPAAALFVVCAASAAIWFWRQPSVPVSREPVVKAPEPQPVRVDDQQPSEVATGTSLQTAAEQPKATPSPARISGTQLVVTTEPPGARVTVNGIGWGTSPVTIRHLAPGDKRVRVNLDGYQTVERGVSLLEGQTGQVSIRLRRLP